MDVDRTMDLVQAFDGHPKETRLLRAAENYGESLRRIHPASPMQAAIHLWIAVESLTEVVTDRLKREYKVATLGDVGHKLGVNPAQRGGDPDPRAVRGEIRRREIFDGDDETHRALREASDGIEHGYLSFGEARGLVDQIFEPAARAVRRSILRESGIPRDDVQSLLGGIFTRPLPLWRPVLVGEGGFAEDTAFDFARPAHMRLDSTLRVHSIDPAAHATEASFDSRVFRTEAWSTRSKALTWRHLDKRTCPSTTRFRDQTCLDAFSRVFRGDAHALHARIPRSALSHPPVEQRLWDRRRGERE